MLRSRKTEINEYECLKDSCNMKKWGIFRTKITERRNGENKTKARLDLNLYCTVRFFF